MHDLENIYNNIAYLHESVAKYAELAMNNSCQCNRLSNNNQALSNIIQTLLANAKTVTVDEKNINLQEALLKLNDIFVNSINYLLDTSKYSIAMLYSLDKTLTNLSLVEKNINAIEAINNKAKYLSLNTSIEAVRAGDLGSSFQVVANEVNELSIETKSLAMNMRKQVSLMGISLTESLEMLKSFAQVDISEHILAKENLDQIITSLLTNNQKIIDGICNADVTNKKSAEITTKFMHEIKFYNEFKNDLEMIIENLINLKNSLHSYSNNANDTTEKFNNYIKEQAIFSKIHSQENIDTSII